MPTEWLNVFDAAKARGVNPDTIRRAIRRQEVTAKKDTTGRWLVETEASAAFGPSLHVVPPPGVPLSVPPEHMQEHTKRPRQVPMQHRREHTQLHMQRRTQAEPRAGARYVARELYGEVLHQRDRLERELDRAHEHTTELMQANEQMRVLLLREQQRAASQLTAPAEGHMQEHQDDETTEERDIREPGRWRRLWAWYRRLDQGNDDGLHRSTPADHHEDLRGVPDPATPH